MAAEAAAAARGDLEGLNREEPDASKAIVFQRSKDAPGGVVGVDGQAVCSAFQFGGCAHQSQTGLVVHQKPDGSTHAVVMARLRCMCKGVGPTADARPLWRHPVLPAIGGRRGSM